jgi:hypothetical protein
MAWAVSLRDTAQALPQRWHKSQNGVYARYVTFIGHLARAPGGPKHPRAMPRVGRPWRFPQ